MMGNNEDNLRAIQERQAWLLREAERERLAHYAQIDRPTLYQQVITKAGDWLIKSGTALKARTPEPARYSEATKKMQSNSW